MANEEVLGPRKTMFVLVIVVGCFAVLWPRILSPLMLGPSREQIKPNQLDREAGCCEVIFETEVAVLELLNEVCSLAVGGVTGAGVGYGKLSPHTVTECRRAVNETCGMDIAAFLKRTDNVGKTTKVLLDTMKSSNSSCLKEHFGVPIWSLSIHPAVNSWAVKDKLKQERSPIRGMGAHPALRERGRAIPPGAPTPPSRGPVPMPPHVRPPPIPGMRPPLGAGAGPLPAPRSSMGFVMPVYTICIIVFFVYTLSKILFKRTSVPYEEVTPDPHFRRRVFRDHSRTSPDKLGPKERDAIVTAISGLVAEVHQQMEASQPSALSRHTQEAQDNHTRPVTNGTVLNNSPVQIVTSEYREPSKEKSPEPAQNNKLETKEASPEPKEPSPEPNEPRTDPKELSPEPKEPTPVSSNSTPENKEIISELQDSSEERRQSNKDSNISEKLEQTESTSVVLDEDNQIFKVKESSPVSKEPSLEPEELILESDESVPELKELSPEPEKNITSEEPTKEPGINSEIVETGKLVDIDEQNAHALETKEVASKYSNETEISQKISEPRDVISEPVEVNVENKEPNVSNQEVRLLSSESKEILLDVVKDNVAKLTEDLLDEARMVTTEELSQQEKLSTPELLEEAIKEEFIIEDDRDENVMEQENASVKVVGMEVTAHAADGGAWPRDPGATATSATPATPHRPHEADEVTSIFLQTEIPHQARVLVADSHSHSHPHSQPPSSPLVVSGKVTLSLIQDAPRDTPDREPESTVDEFTTASALTHPAERDELQSDEEFEEEIEIEEIEEEEEEEEEEPQLQKKLM